MILRQCAIGCSASEPACEQLDGGKVNPGLAADGLCLEVFGQAAVAVEPGESSLDRPASWQELKSRGSIGPLDDLDLPLPVSGQRRRQLPAGIAAIGKDMAQPGEPVADRGEQSGRPIAILDIAGVDPGREEVPGGVGNDVALATVDLLARIIPSRPGSTPPLSVVLTDWLSITPADGLASRPARSRACWSSRKLIVSHTPAACQA